MSYQPISENPEELKEVLAGVLRALASRREPPPLDPDVGAWIAHLFWLKSSLDAGTLEPSQLLEHEAEGLRLMDEVSRDVGQKLHRCPRCGSFTDSMLTCSTCGQPFSRRVH